MEDKVQKAYDSRRNFNNKAVRSGCYAPFVSLYFNSFGDVTACCKNWTFVLGNVSRKRLGDIWKGGKIRELRQTLSKYRFESGCEFCEWEITEGNHQGAFPLIFDKFSVQSMDPEWPSMIEFSGSNICNFECIMCCGENSSSIRAHREALPPLSKVYSEQFFQDLRPFLPHLKMAKFLGGEPFLSQECFRIWDMMIEDRLATPCHVTTNGSLYNKKVERVLESLPVSLSVSIDGGTKETVEKIRVNCRYEELIDNLHRFREYTKRRGTYLGLTYCLMRQNWHEFGDFLLFAESIGCEVFTNTVVRPSHCSLYTLPSDELTRIANEMDIQGGSLKTRLHLNRRVWEDNVRKLLNHTVGHKEEGLTDLLGGYSYDPEGIQDHVTAGERLVDMGQYAEALEEVLKASEDHPYYYYAVALRGHIRHLLGDIEGAERELERALKISSRRPEAFINRAMLRLDQSRLEEGIGDALHAREFIMEGDEMEANVCEVLGFLYFHQGRSSEAIKVLDRLLELLPKNPRVRVQRGLAFRIGALREQALAEAEAALALAPDCMEAIRLKEKLSQE